MEAILTRTGDALTPSASPIVRPSLFARLAQSLAERVTLPHRDLPPEWFRFPLP
jgi:hypothetical protein